VVRYGGEVMVSPSAEDQERLHRVALKLETVDDLMDRRITLAEAVERFEALDAAPEALSNIRASLGGNTDAERTLNQVLSFARVRASQQPKRYNAALARLEAEARSPAAPTGVPN
jgi:predicted component of type VI protein secretion system